MPRIHLMPQVHLRTPALILSVLLAATACSNGGDSGTGGSGSGRGSNSLPDLQLNDGDVLGGGSSVVRIPAADDTGIVRVGSTIVRQGRLPECAGRFADDSLVADSLVEACVSDQPACAVTFQPITDQIEVIPPPLYAPISVEYDLTLLDRDGSATDPVRAVFCFDVGINVPPVATADTFQLTYPSRIDRPGVRYDDRCGKEQGSQGVLANDEDDEHITNECLTAVLEDLPQYASNRDSFASTFRSDGSFVYEAFGLIPPEDSNGRSVDSFTYRISDGVNPVSDPIRVDIVFATENNAPVANDDSFSIPEDSEVQVLAVLNNDSDPDALPLTVVAINNGPGNGVADIRNGTLIEYRPAAGFVGQDNFTYTAEDSGGLTVTANVTINVTNVNDAPVAQNDAVSTNENTPVEVRVLANDSDVEGNTLTIVSVATPLNGTAVSSNGAVTYSPDPGYFGADAFEYTISDGNDTATATVVVTVVSVNVAPVANADELFISAGTSEEFNLLGNDTDGDGDPLSIIAVSSPANGTASLLDSGNVRYTPNAAFSGTDSFTYTLSDGAVESVGQVTIVVTAVNVAPVAVADELFLSAGTSGEFNLLANDTDADGNPLRIVSVTSPANGDATLLDNGVVRYAPDSGFSGSDSFTYTISDGAIESVGQVSVVVTAVNVAPVAVADELFVSAGTSGEFNLLSNDTDSDGDALSVVSVSSPANGDVTRLDDGVVRYTPDSGFSGTDSFSYTISDGALESVGQVSIVVSSVNAPPIAVDDVRSTEEDDPVGIQVLANDSDPDGDSLTLSVLSQPANGGASVTRTGDVIVYSPAAGFSGTDSFTYQISDGNGGVAVATVTVTVTNSNAPPTAVDDAAQLLQGQTTSVSVLANDTDPDGDALTVSLLTPPTNGTAVVQADNSIAYTPLPAFSGTDSIVYSVADGSGGTATATVALTVSAVIVNNPPIANDDIAQATQDLAVNFNILANDSDPDGDALTVSIATPPAGGTASVLDDGRIRYVPLASFTGSDSIVYTVDDGNGGTDSATVSITVVSSNTPPEAFADSATTTQGQAVSIDVLANDVDVDGNALTITSVSPGSDGATSITSGGVTYTPAVGFSGSDSFSYTISDNNGGEDTATVAVTVSAAVNSAPVAVADTTTTPQATTVNIPVLANDSDADGDALSVSITTGPANGFAVIAADNSINYEPAPAFSGTDSLEYAVSDGNGGTDAATVSITVVAVVTNTPPVAAADAAVTDQDQAVEIEVLSNDTDADNDVLSVTAVTQPLNGTVVIGTDGILTYTPVAAFAGTDTFTYDIEDTSAASSTATVTVTVNAIVTNSLPIAVNDSASTEQDAVVSIDVLANDTDVDGDPLTVTAVSLPDNGSAVVNADGGIDYTPVFGFIGDDAFDYTIGDGVSGTATAIVEVTVAAAAVTAAPLAAVNTAPEAVDDSAVAVVGSVTRIRVLDNDVDVDGDSLTLSLDASDAPANGSAAVHRNGRWINYSATVAGIDTFGYIIDDGNGGSDSGAVTVAISDL